MACGSSRSLARSPRPRLWRSDPAGISGSGPPPEVLPDSLNNVAEATPLKHVIVLIQDPWLGFGWNNAELAIVSAILVVAAEASASWLRWIDVGNRS